MLRLSHIGVFVTHPRHLQNFHDTALTCIAVSATILVDRAANAQSWKAQYGALSGELEPASIVT